MDTTSAACLGANLVKDGRVPEELDVELRRERVRRGRVLAQVVRVPVPDRGEENVLDLRVITVSKRLSKYDTERGAHAEVICGTTDVVAIRALPSGVTRKLLIAAASNLEVRLVQLREHRRRLQRTITGRIRGEVDVRLVLEEWIVPSAASARSAGLRGAREEGRAHLLIMSALTLMSSPSSVWFLIFAFCSSKKVTNSGP